MSDLNVIGCTVDEALSRTERFLDEMVLGDQRDSAVIHGYGTGQLRRAIGEYLRNHPLVARFDTGAAGAGRRRRDGGGAEGVARVLRNSAECPDVLFPATFIDDLRTRADIVQVVQDYVPLKKAGNTWKGLCPFHGEKTPSFHVNPDKGFFYCFGCQAGGDVFKFVELQEKVGFQDAVRDPGAEVRRDGAGADRRRRPRRRGRARDAAEDPRDWRRGASASSWRRPPGRARGSSWRRAASAPRPSSGSASASRCPSRDGLRAWLGRQGFEPALLVKSGLVVQRDDGHAVDRFRGRLMIPICRDSGAIVAFGGRSMDADQQPKYLNSPETPIYSKGRTLYGLHLTKADIRRLGYAVLVEGYFDFAQALQAGVPNVVASCGTALTTQQAHLLRRFAAKIVLSYDPDAAGQGAAERSSLLLVQEGFQVNVALLPPGDDPDGFIRKQGVGGLRGAAPDLEAVPRLPARSGGAGRGLRQRRGAARVPEPDAARRGPGPGRGRARPVCGPAGAQGADHRRRRPGRNPEGGRGAAAGADAARTAEFRTGAAGREGADLGAVPRAGGRARGRWRTSTTRTWTTLLTRRILELARGLHEAAPDDVPSALLARLNMEEARLVTGIAAEPRRRPRSRSASRRSDGCATSGNGRTCSARSTRSQSSGRRPTRRSRRCGERKMELVRRIEQLST